MSQSYRGGRWENSKFITHSSKLHKAQLLDVWSSGNNYIYCENNRDDKAYFNIHIYLSLLLSNNFIAYSKGL